MLEMRDIAHSYGGRRVLEVEHFEVPTGQCTVLFGPNGSGKSTFLRIAAVVEMPERGVVLYRGTPVTRGNSLGIRRRLALLLQKPVFFRGTVESNVAYGLRVRGVRPPEARERVARVAARLGIQHLLQRRVDALSGGEAQRVNLARAFVLEPEALFLDEPFSALDAPTRESLLADLDHWLAEAGQTTVFVTHHRDEAALLGDRVAILLDGRVCQTGSVEEVFSMPTSDEVAKLVGVETILSGRVAASDGELLSIAVKALPTIPWACPERQPRVSREVEFSVPGGLAIGEEVLVCIRPEDVVLSRQRPESSVRNWFPGTIARVIPQGRTIMAVLDCGFELKALVTAASWRQLALAPGASVWAGVKATSIHLIRRHGH